jgi:hypothetical protein
MTVSSGLNRISYAGNGTTTVFPVNYYFLDNTHLQVILISSTGVEAQQTLTSNYTVTGAGNEAGGTVTMLVAPPAGTTLVIQRNVPATQETDYLANDPFPAESHERALDKLTMLAQQNERESGRALKIPLAAVPTTSTELPLPQGNKLLAWNSNASAITNLDPSDVITVTGQQNSFADVFTGNGVTTSFTLTRNPGSVFNIDVSINGVTQVPNVDYILAATTLTFTSAPPAVASQILARYSEVFTLNDADAANVRYLPAGGVQTNVQAKLRETVSVKDFGAVGDGVTDDTAAFNLATDAANSSVILREIYIPAGVYRIDGKVYVRKGQHLRGAGAGATQLLFTNPVGGVNTNTGGIVMGFNSLGVQDPSGFAPEVSEFFTLGGSAIACGVAGAAIHNCFISSPISGVIATGADITISDCIFDDGTSLLIISGQNIAVSNCIFYLGSQQIYLTGGANDVVINSCVFEYAKTAAILSQNGNNTNIVVSGSTFLLNTQNAGHQAFIFSQSSASDSFFVSGCTFNNGKGAAYRSNSTNSYASFKSCLINGNKTTSGYAQSVSAFGFDLSVSALADIDGCTFKNMKDTVFKLSTANKTKITNCVISDSSVGVINMPTSGGNLIVRDVVIDTTGSTPITFNGDLSQSMSLDNVRFINTGGTYDITIAGTSFSASVNLANIVGSNRQLFSYTGNVAFSATNLKNWFNAVVASTSRYVEIPFVGAQTFEFSVTANPSSAGSGLYRKSTYGIFDIDYDAPSVETNVSLTTLHSSATGAFSAPSVTAELQTLGGGSSSASTIISGNIILSWPATYASETIMVTPINGVRPA